MTIQTFLAFNEPAMLNNFTCTSQKWILSADPLRKHDAKIRAWLNTASKPRLPLCLLTMWPSDTLFTCLSHSFLICTPDITTLQITYEKSLPCHTMVAIKYTNLYGG